MLKWYLVTHVKFNRKYQKFWKLRITVCINTDKWLRLLLEYYLIVKLNYPDYQGKTIIIILWSKEMAIWRPENSQVLKYFYRFVCTCIFLMRVQSLFFWHPSFLKNLPLDRKQKPTPLRACCSKSTHHAVGVQWLPTLLLSRLHEHIAQFNKECIHLCDF